MVESHEEDMGNILGFDSDFLRITGGFDDWTATLVLVCIVGGEGEVCCFRVAEVFDVDASDKSAEFNSI